MNAFLFFKITFYIAFGAFVLGSLYRISTWFFKNPGVDDPKLGPGKRLAAFGKAILGLPIGWRLLKLVKTLVLDVLLQVHILKTDVYRWCMHMLIFWGFMLLLGMHALESQISYDLLPNYESTLNPYMFLRDLFGAMVVVGVVMAWIRRRRVKAVRMLTNAQDRLALGLLVVIFLSGFALESVKIMSPRVFDMMVTDYAGLSDPEEIEPLKVFWADQYGVVFPDLPEQPDPELLEMGLDMHQENCAFCHAKPTSAFVSYPLTKALTPLAGILNQSHAEEWLWYLHFMACFIGLALLPFTKFFHVISTPVSLVVKGISGQSTDDPANRRTRRALSPDACTHCGTCSLYCSVAPVFQLTPNAAILPSEKLQALKRRMKGKLGPEGLMALARGNYVCTACNRCSELCPSGLDLQELWQTLKQDMAALGFPEPAYRTRTAGEQGWSGIIQERDTPVTPRTGSLDSQLLLSEQADSFRACFRCQTCTNSCPVVANFAEPTAELDFLPHQIMHALHMGLTDMALGARMIWDCTTCYLCQENCPQGVRVTDILYELKNKAHARLQAAEAAGHNDNTTAA